MFKSTLTENDKIQLIGHTLLKRGFQDFFLLFFKAVEGNSFDVELMHEDLFKTFNKVEQNEVLRQIINIAPRSAKTTLAIYFIAYCLAKNPYCQFIYTSYSQDLLNDNSRRLSNILTCELYKKMYCLNSIEEDEKLNIVDDFWMDYLKKDNEFKITTKKITTKAGGVVLFASIGSQITGFGFGSKNRKGFNGCLIIDDGDKPATIRSKKIREKTQQYYDETLLTRANNSNAPIVEIQQRLHIEDLTGYLLKKYDFEILKKPLINKDGICELSKQYTPARIEELKKNNALWTSQYQQEPIAEGGNIIKSEWFRTYEILPKFKQIYITADTAMKVKEANDYSVLQCWGRTELNGFTDYYLIDMIRGKWESPELLEMTQLFYLKYKKIGCSCLFIEDKASGTGLIQSLQRKRIPVQAITPLKDKYMRLSEVLPLIESGYVYIPEKAEWKLDFLAECEGFTADMSHAHDDMIDAMTMGLSDKTNFFTLRNII